MKPRQQFLDLRAWTFDLDLHSSIIEIAHPAGQTQFLRGPLRERPIPNALDIAGDNDLCGDEFSRLGQRSHGKPGAR